nr:hypothetical protein GCM10020092_021530 [Actinoplanes digitatis]
MVGRLVKYMATVRSGAVSTKLDATTWPPWVSASESWGSTTQAASTCRACNADGISENGIAWNRMPVGFPPARRTDCRTVVSPRFRRVLTAIRLLGQVLRRPDRAAVGDDDGGEVPA